MNVIINAAIQELFCSHTLHVLSIEESVLLLPISEVKDNVYFKTL